MTTGGISGTPSGRTNVTDIEAMGGRRKRPNGQLPNRKFARLDNNYVTVSRVR